VAGGLRAGDDPHFEPDFDPAGGFTVVHML